MSVGAGAVLTIDLGALAQNYRTLRNAARGVATAGVIKANGYGLGIEAVGLTLQAEGCKAFFVASVAEGIALRAGIGPGAVIYVIGGILLADAAVFAEHDLIPILNSLDDVAAWKGQPGVCAVHFDTGMNRLGLDAGETAKVLADPGLLDGLNIGLGMSHFASSEDLDDPLNDIQIAKFRAITAGLKLPKWSLCNTAGILRFTNDHYDLVRAGYGLYGGNPLPHIPNPMAPVVKLEARVLQVKPVKAGESVGYNATWAPEADDMVAVLALGYADGYLRSQSSRGHVFWQGQKCLIAGRVSMDLTTVCIGHLAQKPRPGDWMEILGPSQPVDALAAGAGTNGYEMLTRLGARYERRYIQAS